MQGIYENIENYLCPCDINSKCTEVRDSESVDASMTISNNSKILTYREKKDIYLKRANKISDKISIGKANSEVIHPQPNK